jgi:putative transcriptional regulator
MSNAVYIADGQYLPYMVNNGKRNKLMIEIRIDQLLADYGRTFYWLAKETGISHTTLWRLKKGKALGINFETLEKMCQALRCQPGDVFALARPKSAKKAVKKSAAGRVNGKSQK